MVGQLSTQGQIYMNILDTLCSVDSANAAGYATKRVSFGTEAATAIRRHMQDWRPCWPLYVERTGGFLGLFGPYGYDVMFWNDWIGSNPHDDWTAIVSASDGWQDNWVNNPEAALSTTMDNFLRNRTDLFGDLKRLIATADLFDEWAK
jgi:hypothetical protein